MRKPLFALLLLLLISTLVGCPPLTTISPYDGWIAEDVLIARLTDLQDSLADGYAEMVRREIRITHAESAATTERRTFNAVFPDATSIPVELFLADGARDFGAHGEVPLTNPNWWRTVEDILVWHRQIDTVTYIGPSETTAASLWDEHGWNFLRFSVWDDFGEVTREVSNDWNFDVEMDIDQIRTDPVFAAIRERYADELAHLDPDGASGVSATFMFSISGWSTGSSCVGMLFSLTLDLDPAFRSDCDMIVVTFDIAIQFEEESFPYPIGYHFFSTPYVASDPAYFIATQPLVYANSWIFFDASILGGGCFRTYLEAGSYDLTISERNAGIPVAIVGTDGTVVEIGDGRFTISIEQTYDFCITTYQDAWVVFLLVEANDGD